MNSIVHSLFYQFQKSAMVNRRGVEIIEMFFRAKFQSRNFKGKTYNVLLQYNSYCIHFTRREPNRVNLHAASQEMKI